MSEELEFTGERFTPECQREIWYEHYHRYALAAPWCRDARVLDVACGEGYGSALLAGVAASVCGADVAAQAVEHARRRYGAIGNLSFTQADATRLPFADGEFDRIVCFETLEHLGAQRELLQELRRVLRPDGFLVLSSPDKAEYSDRQGFHNAFHVRELYRDELQALVAEVFPASVLLGQRLMFHSAIWAEGELGRAELQTLGAGGELAAAQVNQAPVYWIAVCAASQEHLPPLAGRLWLFDDDAQSVYAHYYHEIRKNMQAGAVLAEREAEIAALKRALADRREPWWRRWLQRG